MPRPASRLFFAGLLAACAFTAPAYAQVDQSGADANRLRSEAHVREMNRLGYEESQRAEQQQQQQNDSGPSNGGERPRHRMRRDVPTEVLQSLVQAELAQAFAALAEQESAAAAQRETERLARSSARRPNR